MPPLPPALRSVRGCVASATAIGFGVLVLAGQLTGQGRETADEAALTAPIAVSFTAMGVLVLSGAPRSAVGRLMIAAGFAASAALLGNSWSTWLPLAWLSQWSWWPPFALIILALLVFPDGRLPSHRWRAVAVWTAVAATVSTVAFAVAAFDHPRNLLTEIDTPLTARAQLLLRIGGVGLLAAIGGLLGVLWALWHRWRVADGDTRLQLMCLLPAGGLFLAGLALSVLGLPGAWAIGAVAVPVAMTVAVLRYRLYDLDQIVNRSVVWLVMTLLVVVGFVGLVAVIRAVLFGGDATRASLAATGLIAVAFEPLRRWIQGAVNRMLYGNRDDPYKVIAQLRELLGQRVEPHALLPLVTETVARSLQLPYVAVELTEDSQRRLHAEFGKPVSAVEAFDMVVHGKKIGRLLVATRGPHSMFTRRESLLLRDIATDAAVAAEATRLVRDLQQSRERLVLAREEQRRRLRRDLHDGLGPSLAGMSMQVWTARTLLPQPSRVTDILEALAHDLDKCKSEVRQLVDELRPPALDNGLEAALREVCRSFDSPTLSVRLRVDQSLGELPAAVEVAVYRIVAEALTNAARHADASSCTVTVERSAGLAVEITDDGIGIDGSATGGVGLGSMRERAAELGGTCTVTAASTTGTVVSIRIPLSATVAP
jgi:signal transduction histidine kinase